MLTQLLAPWRPRRRTALVLVALLLLTTVLTAAPTLAAPPTPAALDGSIDWANSPSVISNGSDVAYPWSAVDSNNVTHIIYMTSNGGIWYTNNATRVNKRLDLGGSTAPGWPFAAIAVGPNNVVHVAYLLFNKDNQIYYRRSNDGGATWSSREQISNGSKAASPTLAVDSDNNAHIVWIDNRCGTQYNVYYRLRRNDGTKSGTEAPKSECGTYQTRPQITMIGGIPQVVFQRGDEVYYRRRESNGLWIGDNLSHSNKIFSGNATIASDGVSKLFVAWDEGINGHDILFRTSFDGGLSWSNIVNYSNNSTLSSYPNVTWSDATKRAYIVWQDDAGSEDGKSEIWEREFDPTTLDTTFADRVSHFTGRSQWPTMGIGSSQASIVWMDETGQSKGFFQVWDWDGTLKTVVTPTGCKGTLNLGGDPVGNLKVTRSITLTGTITPEANCVPEQMQISLNEPITAATPLMPYSANLSLRAQENLCLQTVYVRLFRKGAGATIFSDSVTVDTGVDAIVQVSNPHRSGLPAFPDTPRPGANDGAPNYTREPKFFLTIHDSGDCTGLTTFDIPSVGSGTITDGSYAGWFDLPNITTAGLKQFIVNIHDKVAHKTAFQQSITYDPNRPVLDSTTSPTVTAPLSITSVLAPLAFDNIRVTDDLYGPNEGLPADAEFWGVLVANSTTNVTPDNPGLKWFPVQVPNSSSTFTVTWDLLTGLSNPPPQNTGGDVYVYIRFIDGAGNETTKAIAVRKIALEPDYTLPRQYLPAVYR